MSELGFDLAEFEAELAEGKYDSFAPTKVKKAAKQKAALKVVKKTNPSKQVAAGLLNTPVEKPTEIPVPKAIVHQELEIHCGFCSCVHTFTSAKSVRMQYKNSRSHFATLTETVENEIANLQLPVEKMITKMVVHDCDNCREAEEF